MFIDIHTHAYHPKISDKVLAQLEDHYGIKPVGTGQIDDLIARAKKAGLEKVVVHNAATAAAQVVPANNWAIRIHRENPEVLSFGTLHPDYPDFERELDRLERNGIKGIKFHADFQGFRLDDHRLWPIFEALSGRFMVMLHVGDNLPPDENNSSPDKVAAIVRDFPGLTVIAAHLGGYLHWQYVLEHLLGKDVYIDTSSSLSFIDDDTLHRIFDGHPRERILFGSDYPLFDPGDEIGLLRRRLSLRDAELESLLSAATALFR
ncbi:amidohydrolase 2 [Solidesulfovibrio fructosivorans JJ]]|uniref:Amidohydrolase 2 n=1 Tax=Solidesulfovibrio fructosivorans JJ] TaxID=596151 RepID=E1JUZ7_SOLFR|nr:amidohydrolase family protein [Solidesulfovibrio fructosivorans]EFL51911.1 amidohydrolase 2 [Solidesulfovibrio fructosivorans JJ]]